MAYLGSKNGEGVFHAICALMPAHDTYIEPFVGTGAILARKAPAARSIVLDKDPRMVAEHADRRDVDARLGCALEYLAALDPSEMGRVLIYADPPYPWSTRTSRKRYRHELTDDEHRQLAAALARLGAFGAHVIVSTYPSPLYDELYGDWGWGHRELQAMTRGGVRTEQLWFNFDPAAVAVHWATFAGDGWIDRQRIKRKAARWARMYGALPPGERQAVMAAILGVRDLA